MNEFIISIDNKKLPVKTDDFKKVIIHESEYNCSISKLSDFTYKLVLDNKIYHITAFKLSNGDYNFLIDGHYFETSVKTSLEEKIAQYLDKNTLIKQNEEIYSPMPGLILKVYKTVGEKVNQGDPVLLLEAMKMENEIHSSKSGVIKEIFVKQGESVEKNQLLISIK